MFFSLSFYLAGKDPQLLRVLKWHWKLNNLHSTGREWLLALPPFAWISLLEKTSEIDHQDPQVQVHQSDKTQWICTKNKWFNSPQWSIMTYNDIIYTVLYSICFYNPKPWVSAARPCWHATLCLNMLEISWNALARQAALETRIETRIEHSFCLRK